MLQHADCLLSTSHGLAMSLVGLPYPDIDPVAFEIPGLGWPIRWYSLAYISGLIAGWRIAIWLSRQPGSAFNEDEANEFPTWVLFGLMLGGRFGYVLFYKPRYYFGEGQWWEVFAVWQGGMSFHGGLLGIMLATYLFARTRKIPVAAMSDLVVLVAPIGLFLGRCANFINGELYGRQTDHWIGMVFPKDPEQWTRHPSQLYEAGLEGVALFTTLWVLRRTVAKKFDHGFLSGAFLIGYGVFRSTAELFRQPDEHLGFIISGLTMGQLLSFPMVLAGAIWIYFVVSKGPVDHEARAAEKAAARKAAADAKDDAKDDEKAQEADDDAGKASEAPDDDDNDRSDART